MFCGKLILGRHRNLDDRTQGLKCRGIFTNDRIIKVTQMLRVDTDEQRIGEAKKPRLFLFHLGRSAANIVFAYLTGYFSHVSKCSPR